MKYSHSFLILRCVRHWRGVSGIFLLALVLAAGCKNKRGLDANGVPGTLLVAVYEGDNPGEVTKVLNEVRPYLEKELGVPVEFQKSTDYTTVIEALLSGKVHMAYLSPFAYILATQKQKLVPLVAPGLNGKPYTYQSLIFTSPHSGLKSMDDVKTKSHGLTLCFADPASTSGHLVPRAYLTSIGLDPKTAWKQTMFAGTHYASILAVKSGKVDVGCSFRLGYDKMLREGIIHEGDIRILWTSDPIVESPICMRPDISPAFDEKVREAYMNMKTKAPEAFHDYWSMYMPKQADSMSYIRVDDSIYNGLRKIAGTIGDLTPTKK